MKVIWIYGNDGYVKNYFYAKIEGTPFVLAYVWKKLLERKYQCALMAERELKKGEYRAKHIGGYYKTPEEGIRAINEMLRSVFPDIEVDDQIYAYREGL